MIKILTAILSVSFLSFGALASSPKISVPTGDFKESISNIILYDSDILNAFWVGDDGVECGEPTVNLVAIDYSQGKIVFDVHPEGRASGCEHRSYVCEVTFEEDVVNRTLLLQNTLVLPTTSAGCTQ